MIIIVPTDIPLYYLQAPTNIIFSKFKDDKLNIYSTPYFKISL